MEAMSVPALNDASQESSHVGRIKAIGTHQRNLTLVVLALIALHFLSAVSLYLSALLLVGAIYAVVLTYRLLNCMGTSPGWKWMALIGLFIPLINIVILLIVNYR